MSNLFISYAREDRDFVAKLVNVLKGAGHEVWWDNHLEGGDQFRTSIEQALDAASSSVVVWSERSRMSRWVNDEAEAALQQSKLVPLRIDGCRIPLGFSGLHTLDFRSWDGSVDAAPIRALFQKLERSGESTGKVKRPALPTLLTGALVAVLLAILFGLAWTTIVTPSWWSDESGLSRRTLLEATLASLVSTLPVCLWAAFRARRFAQANFGAIFGRTVKTYSIAATIALIIVALAMLGGSQTDLGLGEKMLRVSSGLIAGMLVLAALIATASFVMFVGSRMALRPK